MDQRNLPGAGRGETRPARGFIDDYFYTLQRQMNRLFEDVWTGKSPLTSFGAGDATSPSIDVSETEEAIEIRAELPGVDEKDVDISLSGDLLTIKGEKKAETEQKDKNWVRVERSYGSFQRTIRVPAEVKEDACEARFDKGVLTIRLPKAESSRKSRKIEVKSGG